MNISQNFRSPGASEAPTRLPLPLQLLLHGRMKVSMAAVSFLLLLSISVALGSKNEFSSSECNAFQPGPCGIASRSQVAGMQRERGSRKRSSVCFSLLLKYGCCGLPRWFSGKESTCQTGDAGLIPGSGRSPRGRHGNPRLVFLPGESHGQRNLAGYNPGVAGYNPGVSKSQILFSQ